MARVEAVGYIAGAAEAGTGKSGGFNHPIFVPARDGARADVLSAYAPQAHPAWTSEDMTTVHRFVLDVSMQTFNGREFQSVRLLGIVQPQNSQPQAEARARG